MFTIIINHNKLHGKGGTEAISVVWAKPEDKKIVTHMDYF